jgi:hypothetical protein
MRQIWAKNAYSRDEAKGRYRRIRPPSKGRGLTLILCGEMWRGASALQRMRAEGSLGRP